MTNILSIIIVCSLGVLLLMTMTKPLQGLLRFFTSATIGGICVWVCQGLGFAIGINPVTLVALGILGIPGFVGLLALSLFL